MTVPRLRSLFLSVNQHIMKTFCPKNHLLGVSIQECGSYYAKVIPSLFSLWCSSDVAKMHSSAVEEYSIIVVHSGSCKLLGNVCLTFSGRISKL